MAASPPAPIVSLRGVGKLFGTGLLALDGLDLDVRDGEFLSLLGPSGCGKSTALRIIAGLSEPSRGTVIWRDGADARRGIGFVFQEPTLMPWTTVFGNVFLPLKLTGVDKAAAAPRIMATLSRVGLADFADAYPRELSGGMRMRVSIARALGIVLWDLVVRINGIPPYILPSPGLVLSTLFTDWPILWSSLLATLATTLEGLALAVAGGIGLAVLFNQSRLIEHSLYPYAVILQVTPVVAIAPLLLIYLPQQ